MFFLGLFEVNQTQPLQQFQYRLLQQITGGNTKTNEVYDSPQNSFFWRKGGGCKKLIANHLKIVWSGQDKSGLLVRGVFPNHKQEPYNQGGHIAFYKGKFPELFFHQKGAKNSIFVILNSTHCCILFKLHPVLYSFYMFFETAFECERWGLLSQ